MTRASLTIAGLLIALVPALAAAQSAVSNPAVPGSGYQVPDTVGTSPQPLAADGTDPAVPGSGYKIVPAPRAVSGPLAADVQDPGKPGDGYQVPTPTDAKSE
ncbi:MAG TPA: hypothetical protein VMH36_07620 [Alphaproteobacteria bacterium]|nr:hypothetical protein [Alphaproteobacteria bacterium]